MKKIRNKGGIIIPCLIVLLVISFIVFLIVMVVNEFGPVQRRYLKTDVSSELDEAIEVRSIRNLLIERVSFGGGTALGSTEVHCFNLNQLEQLADGSSIYTSVEEIRFFRSKTLFRTYAAFSKEGVLFIYRKKIDPPPLSEETKESPLLRSHCFRGVDSFNSHEAVFCYELHFNRWFNWY